jgi:hypothetical protein
MSYDKCLKSKIAKNNFIDVESIQLFGQKISLNHIAKYLEISKDDWKIIQ